MVAKHTFDKEILKQAEELYKKTASIKELRKFLADNTDLRKTQIYNYSKQIRDKENPRQFQEEGQGIEGELEFKEDYSYNSHTKDYVFFTYRILGKPICLKESTVKAMLERYSSFDGDVSSINELVSRFGIRREAIIFILRALRKTHDSLPILDEELLQQEPDDIVEDLMTQRLFAVNRKFEKRAWSQTVKEAKMWREFQQGELNPYKEFVEGFAYRHKGYSLPVLPRTRDNRAYMVGVSDVHFGAYASPESLYLGTGWSIEKAISCFKKYTHEFYNRVSLEKNRPELLYLLVFGDLAHGLNGKTEKGTPLENVHPAGEPQVEAGYYCLDYHIQYGLDMGFEIIVEAVPGNHSYYGDWAIYKFVEMAYSKDERVKVNIAGSRWAMFKYLNSLFLMEHGASPFYKAKVPREGSGRDSYVQRLLLARPQELAETKHRYFLTADQHRHEVSDRNGFEFIRFGTMLTGDKYADHLALNGRARQNVLEVDEEGVRAIFNFYTE